MSLGVHIIQYPTGRYGFVGTLPIVLADRAVPATMADTLGQRSFKNERGELLAWRFPVFTTRELALEYARNCDVAVIED